MKKRKFFISFTSLMPLVALNIITEQDLQNGLFCFMASRGYVFCKTEKLGWECIGGVKKEKSAEAHKKIKRTIILAEQEGRCVFFKRVKNVEIGILNQKIFIAINQLLKKNGYSEISEKYRKDIYYTDVKKTAIEETNPNLEVI